MAIFKWKNLMEQLDRACWVQRANMWKNCSLSAVQRKTAFVEESWWPECNLSGSMPWCSFPWHKHLPRLAQKDCCTVYSLNLIHEFTSLFSTNLLYVGLRRKAFPGKQAKVDTGHQCFSVVAQATPQDSPKASPMAVFKWKNLMVVHQGARASARHTVCVQLYTDYMQLTYLISTHAHKPVQGEHQGLCPLKKRVCFWTTGKRTSCYNNWEKKLLNNWSYGPNEWKVEKAECQHVPIPIVPLCQHHYVPTLPLISCAYLQHTLWRSSLRHIERATFR